MWHTHIYALKAWKFHLQRDAPVISCLARFEAKYVPSAQYRISPEATDVGNGDETEGR